MIRRSARLAVFVVATFRFPERSPARARDMGPAARETMLSVSIALLTMAAMAGGIPHLRQMRCNREVNANFSCGVRRRDALLTTSRWRRCRSL